LPFSDIFFCLRDALVNGQEQSAHTARYRDSSISRPSYVSHETLTLGLVALVHVDVRCLGRDAPQQHIKGPHVSEHDLVHGVLEVANRSALFPSHVLEHLGGLGCNIFE